MAHFAEIDQNNTVLRVVVVENKKILDSNGQESEQIGKEFLYNLLGGNWVQTSYNGNFRGRYAGQGFTYSQELDMFIPPQPFSSWILDEQTGDWNPPIPYPNDEDNFYKWNEETQNWDIVE